VRTESRDGHAVLVMEIRYDDRGRPLIDGIRRVSKPGRRVYAGADALPKVRSGLGISVISTSKGILSDEGARAASVGGEVVCEVW
jgi:small subunit ribosomal protein S8